VERWMGKEGGVHTRIHTDALGTVAPTSPFHDVMGVRRGPAQPQSDPVHAVCARVLGLKCDTGLRRLFAPVKQVVSMRRARACVPLSKIACPLAAMCAHNHSVCSCSRKMR
jgi:hypothetical protein